MIDQKQRRWVPLRFLECNKWIAIWNGQDTSACCLLDIVEDGEQRKSWPVVKQFLADAATIIGFLPEENVDRVQLFYRWIPPQETPDYECNASHDLTNLLPLAFQWRHSIVYGTIDVAISVGGLHVLDLPGIELMEGVAVSQGVQKALERGPETRPCYCWRDVARKVLANGGDTRGKVTIRVEVEEEQVRCEGIQCTAFLTLQARLLMNARSLLSNSDRRAVIVGHSDKRVLRTLRRLLSTIGAQSRKTSYIQDTGKHCDRTYYKLFWYPEESDFVDPRKDHGPTFTAFWPECKPVSPPYCLVQFADRGTFLVDGVRYLPYAANEPKITGRPWSTPVPVRRRRRKRHVR